MDERFATQTNKKIFNGFLRNKTPIDVSEAQDLRTEEDNKTKRAIQELIKVSSYRCYNKNHRTIQAEEIDYLILFTFQCYGLGLPAEIRGFDKGSAKVFTHLLEEESYPHFESRVMLAGEQGTGKTTIARYLIGKGPTRMRKSTDGIGLYTGLSYIDRETEEWLDGKQVISALRELTDYAVVIGDTVIFLKALLQRSPYPDLLN
ncbi:unnamed protein product [Mytilus coruscus]|uniref:Uncharacterized protein n=1 Tax=Mytilus coruscus TaxID=42192 RepID=A0A6J8EIN6_MYTCO|nr:unnamed protein product [Mytilus coruscus]